MPKKIRILLADDHHVIRSGLQALFKREKEIAIVGEASDGDQAVQLAKQLKPDVALLDISMPAMSGLDATRRIKEQHPDIKVIILTIHENESYVYQMIRAGANGYLLKNTDKNELLEAIRTVMAGEQFFSPGISRMMVDEHFKRVQQGHGDIHPTIQNLTSREVEVLRHIAQGHTNKEIADMLSISVRTVNSHRTNLMRKLNIHETAGLTRFAVQQGIVDVKL